MKKLELNQMENLEGGIPCTKADILAFTAGAAIGGAIFFGIGGLVTGYAAFAISATVCYELEH